MWIILKMNDVIDASEPNSPRVLKPLKCLYEVIIIMRLCKWRKVHDVIYYSIYLSIPQLLLPEWWTRYSQPKVKVVT